MGSQNRQNDETYIFQIKTGRSIYFLVKVNYRQCDAFCDKMVQNMT